MVGYKIYGQPKINKFYIREEEKPYREIKEERKSGNIIGEIRIGPTRP